MRMDRIATLREQASVLRALAGSFDIHTIRDQLIELAARCDDLANSIERDLQLGGLSPAASSVPRRPE